MVEFVCFVADKHFNEGSKNAGVSERGLEYIKAKLSKEYELYNYIVQRLFRQKEEYQL